MRYRKIIKVLPVVLACIFIAHCLSGMEKPEQSGGVESKPYRYAPGDAARMEWDRGLFRLSLRARRFAQGNAVNAEIIITSKARLPRPHMEYDGRAVKLITRDRGYGAMLAIAPDEKPGEKTITLSWERDGSRTIYNFYLTVRSTEFKKFTRAINLGRFSNISIVPSQEVLSFIEECSRKKREVFDESTSGVLKGPISHPRDAHFVTSPFWASRRYQRYRVAGGKRFYLKASTNAHSGVDLRGEVGDPVFAMAAGRIAIAEPMYYEGNYIVVDHGNRIFSSYMHLEGFAVKEGQNVKAGELIGHVGSTGLSTGAHLHVSFSIDGVPVDPISLLYTGLQ